MPFNPTDLLLPVGLIVIFYFMIIRPQKKKEKQMKEMLDTLNVGDQVVTIGGISGTIFSLDDESFVLETGADRTKIKFMRWAIRSVEQKEQEK